MKKLTLEALVNTPLDFKAAEARLQKEMKAYGTSHVLRENMASIAEYCPFPTHTHLETSSVPGMYIQIDLSDHPDPNTFARCEIEAVAYGRTLDGAIDHLREVVPPKAIGKKRPKRPTCDLFVRALSSRSSRVVRLHWDAYAWTVGDSGKGLRPNTLWNRGLYPNPAFQIDEEIDSLLSSAWRLELIQADGPFLESPTGQPIHCKLDRLQLENWPRDCLPKRLFGFLD